MKSMKRIVSILPIIAIILAVLGVLGGIAGIGVYYYGEVQTIIERENTDHVGEIYGQVDDRVDRFVKDSLGNLHTWSQFTHDHPQYDYVRTFISERQKSYEFKRFYLFASDGSGRYKAFDFLEYDEKGEIKRNEHGSALVAPETSAEEAEHNGALVFRATEKELLFPQSEAGIPPKVSAETKRTSVLCRLEDRIDGETKNITLFAIPTNGEVKTKKMKDPVTGEFVEVIDPDTQEPVKEWGQYGREGEEKFEYSAIGIGYESEPLAHSMNVSAFSGKAEVFMVEDGGTVILSSRGSAAIDDYFKYLGKRLGEEKLQQILTYCNENPSVHGIMTYTDAAEGNTYLYYKNVGDSKTKLLLFGTVPVSVASSGLSQVQGATMRMLLECFAMIIGVVSAIAIYRYLYSRKRSEVEKRLRNAMFETLSNNVDDVFIMLDAQTRRPDFISSNIDRLLGIPHKVAMRDIKVLKEVSTDPEKDLTIDDIKQIPHGGRRSWECECINAATKELRWYRETIYHDVIAGVDKYILILSDETSDYEINKKVQQALEVAKSANAAKSNFLSNMSHDIRTPMNAIIGLSTLISQNAENPEKVREYVQKMSSSGQHLLSLINDVLDMSKIESGKTTLTMEEFKPAEFIEDLSGIIIPQAKAKNQNLEIYVEGEHPEKVLGDKAHLSQILLNVLSNAIKYTSEGGTIELTICGKMQSDRKAMKTRFIIKDTGYGMSPEFVKKIFDPFSREITPDTKGVQGTGLGMTIVKNLVDLMGGTIGVESELGKGSTFTLDFSFLPSVSEDEIDEFWKKNGIERMLIADDSDVVRESVRGTLSSVGINAVCVADGDEAVEEAVRAHKAKEDFDVIILDWKMPRMDGVAAAREIRGKISKNTPILVLSSYDWSDIEEEARKAGINAFLSKPFFLSAFKWTINSLRQKAEKESGKADEGKKSEESPLKDMFFLVAEDNELNAEILSELLAMEGAKFEIKPNGKEAFEEFSASPKDKYDMILMDVQMPVMNGYEATRAIRACAHERAKSIPIIAMTANAFADDIKNSLDAGMTAHLSKPINMTAVCNLIASLKNSEKDGGG